MTALAANLETNREDGEIIAYPVKASTVIYKGGLVVDDGGGYAQPGKDGSGLAFLGVALEGADNSASAVDGAIFVRVYKTGTFQFTKASALQTDVGTAMVIHDDQTVGATSTNSIGCGYVTEIPDATHVKIRIDTVVR